MTLPVMKAAMLMHKRRVQKASDEKILAVMKELPERRLESCQRERVKVDSGSLIYADRNVYSVQCRLD